MKTESPLAVTLPNSVGKRLDVLTLALNADPEILALVTAARSIALRYALHHGLVAMTAAQQNAGPAHADGPDDETKPFRGGGAEPPAPGTSRITLRLPPQLIDRLDAMVVVLREDPHLTSVLTRITRSTAIRIALAKGLTVLERRYAITQPRRHPLENIGLGVDVEGEPSEF